jgi:hypothetical protein
LRNYIDQCVCVDRWLECRFLMELVMMMVLIDL